MKNKYEVMTDDAIVVLTEILIKEHLKGSQEKFIATKEELARFCIKVVKEMQRIYEK